MGKTETMLDKAKAREAMDPMKLEHEKGEFYNKLKKIDVKLAEEYARLAKKEDWSIPLSEAFKHVNELRRYWLERRAMAGMIADIIDSASEKTGWAEYLSERNEDLENENKRLREENEKLTSKK